MRLPIGGELDTAALLLRPLEARAGLVLGHGAGSDIRHPLMERLALALAEAGFASLRYRFPFRERGGGRDSDRLSIQTVQAACALAGRLAPELPWLAGGHSFGGRMTSLAAAEGFSSPVEALAFFAFPLHAPGKPGLARAAHLPAIRLPMLFFSGTRDTFADPALLAQAVAEAGPHARLHWLEGADHGYRRPARIEKTGADLFSQMAAALQTWHESLSA